MSETITFKADQEDQTYQFTVKKDFFIKYSKSEECDVFNLIVIKRMNKYLHNENGPAVIRLLDDYSEKWINGKYIGEYKQ